MSAPSSMQSHGGIVARAIGITLLLFGTPVLRGCSAGDGSRTGSVGVPMAWYDTNWRPTVRPAQLLASIGIAAGIAGVSVISSTTVAGLAGALWMFLLGVAAWLLPVPFWPIQALPFGAGQPSVCLQGLVATVSVQFLIWADRRAHARRPPI